MIPTEGYRVYIQNKGDRKRRFVEENATMQWHREWDGIAYECFEWDQIAMTLTYQTARIGCD